MTASGGRTGADTGVLPWPGVRTGVWAGDGGLPVRDGAGDGVLVPGGGGRGRRHG
ncbi:hypothetical protein [Streptomyces sp. CB02400]|uniref:hypothetical protein n=1 Tax=Streptomyces sp. CB02400 TaxID=1703944 RepID=UPI001F3D9FE3|nr:hypothetical protein [Streptomyces sp. CB02400]